MAFGELCEADSELPDGFTPDYDIGNCGNHDVFEYTCQPDTCTYNEVEVNAICPSYHYLADVYSAKACYELAKEDSHCYGGGTIFSWNDKLGTCYCSKDSCQSRTSANDFSTYQVVCPTSECIAYSKEACEEAATALGLSLGGGGFNFTGNYVSKGCYTYSSGTYAQYAYYGTGGTDAEISNTSLGFNSYGERIRVSGWDCFASTSESETASEKNQVLEVLMKTPTTNITTTALAMLGFFAVISTIMKITCKNSEYRPVFQEQEL